jgi:hypothetical protein
MYVIGLHTALQKLEDLGRVKDTKLLQLNSQAFAIFRRPETGF